jgi:hypothetical protein
MARNDQISDVQFDRELEVYRNVPTEQQARISSAIQILRLDDEKRGEFIGIRLALHMALISEGLIKLDLVTNSGAQEYDDIFVGQKIYQEVQEG